MPDREQEKQKEDLAAALERLAGGPVPPADGGAGDPAHRQASSSRPAVPRLSSNRPLAPGSSAGAAAPLQPVAPPPQPQRSRPVIPTTRKGAPIPNEPTLVPTPLVDDDDAVIVPAPTPDVFLPKHHPAPPARARLLASLALRRTLIPILLTSGLMLPALGIMWFMTGEESPFRKPGLGMPVTLITVGVVLLILGLVNALYVKHQLQQSQQV
jgi:hypothetical protein